MSTVSEDLDRMSRWGSLAATWFRKASLIVSRLQSDGGSKELRWVAGYEAARLLASVLSDAESLVAGLAEDQIGEVDEAVRSLAAKVRAHRLAAALGNVEGRTPDEAAAFLAKAEELRGRS